MINIMKADLYRITRSKGMLFFILALIGTYAISIAYKEAGGIFIGSTDVLEGTSLKMDIEQAARNFTYYFLFIIPVFCIITAEFSEHTVKNTISSMISRKQYFIAKFIFTELTVIALFLCGNILFYLVNSLVNGEKYTSPFGDFMKAVAWQLPIFIGITGVFILLAVLFRKAALFNSITIIAPIIYPTVGLVLYGIESTKTFAEKYLLKYEIGYMLSSMAMGCTDSYRRGTMIVSILALVLSFAAGYLVFTKRDID